MNSQATAKMISEHLQEEFGDKYLYSTNLDDIVIMAKSKRTICVIYFYLNIIVDCFDGDHAAVLEYADPQSIEKLIETVRKAINRYYVNPLRASVEKLVEVVRSVPSHG